MSGAKPSRVAFISDVHSNLEALEAVLDEVGKLEVFCAGDIVGYGASPNEVVGLLRAVRATCVRGNHDQAAIDGDVGEFNPRAAVAAAWTARQLTPESREFLESLPQTASKEIGGKRVFMAHGSPEDPMWEYVLPSTHSDLFEYYLQKTHSQVIALGHTHLAFEWRSDDGGVVFNPGSVGQPRDRDPRAKFAILTIGEGTVEVELRQVEYEVERAAKKILESGLPSSLASQLLSGD